MKASIFIHNMLKNIATILLILMVISMLFPYLSYGSQYRENTSIDNINESKYPGYKQLLKALKTEHPNWTFTLFYTGLNWSDVVYNETATHGMNLVQGKEGEWLCASCSTKVYEGSNWYCASTKAVSYYLDPRNFLYENKIFQFERLSYSDGTYTVEGVEKILSGTFMANTSPRSYYGNSNYSSLTFAEIMYNAGVTYKVSPYHIASRIRQEIIVSGGGPSNSVTGTVSGYEGIYNFYNYGATTGSGAIERGLKYAQNKGWTSPEAAINGGTQLLANSYISKGQDTLYLEKYNVSEESSSLYRHQYQANISAANSEGSSIYKSYSSMGVIDNSFNFIIPVYEGMPATISPMPNTEYNIVTENVVVKSGKTNINIREEKTTSSTSLTKVNGGDVLLRIEKGIYSENGYIWDKVVLSNGTIGYIASDYIEKTSDVRTCSISTFTTKSVSIRNGPGTNKTEIIYSMQSGEGITVIDKASYSIDGVTWDRVQLSDGTQGFVESQYLGASLSSTEGDIVRVATQSSPLRLREEPNSSNTLVLLPKGTFVIRLQENVANTNGIQWDKVKTFDGLEGYVSAEYLELVAEKSEIITEMNKFTVDETNNYIKCEPNTQVLNILEKYSNAVIKDNSNATITNVTQKIGTGNVVQIGEKNYTVVKLGDANGDGTITSADYVRVKNKIRQKIELNSAQMSAADVNGDGTITSADYVRIKNYIRGIANINI